MVAVTGVVAGVVACGVFIVGIALRLSQLSLMNK